MADIADGARALGVEFPLVQAGMGGIANPDLAVAVCEAGALGTIALYKLDAERSRDLVAETAERTGRAFGVNVIPEVAGEALLRRQLDAALGGLPAGRTAVLNSYGLPPRWLAEALRGGPYRLLVQVGTADDAARATDLGCAVVALQGTEAGGHLLGRLTRSALLAETAGRGLGVPLLAAGGLSHGAELAAASQQGAAGWMCGTAFVAAVESGAHPRYKQALVAASPGDTVITDRFDIGWPGRRHRVLRGVVTDSPAPLPSSFIAWTTVAGGRQPVPRGSAAAPTAEAEGGVDEMARYAGTGCVAVTAVTGAARIVTDLRTGFLHALKESNTHGR
ncbi:hypothetical protein Lfu02_03800 [Longispora fulva]|uniref:Nitronate monooxygenase n=1 Tax=Longispora fulva TaxID=619741 RepID=A0A8J7GRQ1_9ACTN|nr:nitronate monooxygenase [Longispora fulva]MBG6135751.1 nitronate monooxygenase [Longispora fulva]GIG56008.1 hypothetical protein Lfu02_03800 [Longispora fulva]